MLWLVGSPQHHMPPPAFHLAGLALATFVAMRLQLLAIARWRVPFSVTRASATARPPGAVLKASPPKAHRPLPTVKPRDQFGLRGNKQKTVP